VTDPERISLLAARLGLPQDSLSPALAMEALRHGSYVHERSLAPGHELLRSNERLEFLGDAVLGFLTARIIYDRFPDAPEGELTRLRASLVREESLAMVARELELGELLLLGRGEQRSGGRDNPGRLADALEAVLGAVALSCGIERAQQVVERLLAPLFENEALARDPKTELQQLFQSRRRTPHYRVLAVAGPDHARLYDVEVDLDGLPLGRGMGRSKKEAEQAAARAALETPEALERALIDEPVAIADPDPLWPALAAEEIARLRGALGEVPIEHVGSTAVPRLAAAPVIDLVAGVRDPATGLRIPEYEACGAAGVPGRILFRKRGAAAFNLQVVEEGGPLWRDALALRDYLAAHAGEAERYESRKRAAVESGAITLLTYSQAMAPVLAELLERARGWAAARPA
jgi:ribonuclease-3